MRTLLILALLLAIGVAATLLLRDAPAGGELPRDGHGFGANDSSSASAPEGHPRSMEPPSPRTITPMGLRVVDESGRPIAGARVDRIPRPADWQSRLAAWPEDLDADVRAGTRTRFTDSTGLADVPMLDEGVAWDGSLLWVQATGRRSNWVNLPADSGTHTLDDIRLAADADIEVTVTDIADAPVAGAIVTCRADFGDWPTLSAESRLARQFEWLPRASSSTDARGVAHLPPLPARMWIRATAGSLCSEPWSGVGPRKVVLRLVSSCTVEGRVVDDEGHAVTVGGSVSCQARRGYDGSFLALSPTRADGSFGPVRLPIATSDGFLLQYFGGEYEAAQVLLPAPEPGARSTVEIRTRLGPGIDLRVADEQGHPLAGVGATTQWMRDGQWNRIDRKTNADGRARLTNLPTGQAYVRLRKPGYVPALKELFRTEEWTQQPLEVHLARAASVEGVCTRSGRPVRSFTVYFWTEQPRDGGKVVISDSEDGSFRIDEAAPGLVQLMATTDEVVQSALVTLTAGAGECARASFDLPAPRTARGRVIDALTGKPVPGARVSAILLSAAGSIRPWKPARVADERGQFELPGFGSVEGRIRVEAEGHALREIAVPAGTEREVDLDVVALHEAIDLEIRLRGGDSTNYASFGLTLRADAKLVPGQRFSADGTTRVAGLAPGPVQLTLEAYDGSTDSRTCILRAGVPNLCVFDLDGRPLDVDVIPPSGAALPADGSLIVSFVDRSGVQHEQGLAIPKSGRAHLDVVDSDRVLMQVLDTDGGVLAMGEFTLPPAGPRRIEFAMSPAPLRLRLRDADDAPVAGAQLLLRGIASGVEWRRACATDANGEASLADRGPGELFVAAFHPDGDALPCRRLQPAEIQDGRIEVRMARGIPVELELMDGSDRLAGVELLLEDECGLTMAIGRRLSSAEGRVRFERLAPGEYRVRIDHPGIWPVLQAITVTPSASRIALPVRRLGSASVRVRSNHGVPQSGLALELVDETSGARVGEWIRTGALAEPEGGLRTGATGSLVVHAIPHGTYRCTLDSATGERIERTVVVPPYATGELEIVVP